MYSKILTLITLFIATVPLAVRADLVTVSIEGEFYSVGDQVTSGAHRLDYTASFVFDTLREPDVVTAGGGLYRNAFVSGSLSVGDLNASFGSDISNFLELVTLQNPPGVRKVIEIQIGESFRFPPPPITQTGGEDLGMLSRMILLFDRLYPVDIPFSLDEALIESASWSLTPIVGFRNIPGVGYYEFYGLVTSLNVDRQSVASVSVPGSIGLLGFGLVLLRRSLKG